MDRSVGLFLSTFQGAAQYHNGEAVDPPLQAPVSPLDRRWHETFPPAAET
jgi:hypothetical protein